MGGEEIRQERTVVADNRRWTSVRFVMRGSTAGAFGAKLP